MAALNKIAHNSTSRQNPSELETALASALFDLESNTTDLKASLRPLQFVSAREVRREPVTSFPPGVFVEESHRCEFGGSQLEKNYICGQ
jgi:small subunit ribosomal protein S7e